MKKMSFIIIVLLGLFPLANAGDIDWKQIGSIKPRHASDIESSNWSVGAETMDRDCTIYKNWKDHLEPLGIKKARIQGGWAKTEKQKGVYDFTWLDEIIFDRIPIYDSPILITDRANLHINTSQTLP